MGQRESGKGEKVPERERDGERESGERRKDCVYTNTQQRRAIPNPYHLLIMNLMT